MAGSISKALSRAKKSFEKAVQQQKRKRAMSKAGDALKTTGKAVAVLGVLAGAAYATRLASSKRRQAKRVAARKRVVAAAATAVGATAIASRVKRGKRG
jgi:hypothetical protein